MVDHPFRSTIPLAALLAGAALLRLDGVRYGLPASILNVDEQSIVPRAWRMTHGAGANPDWFDYPTLLMYLLAPLQAAFAEPSYLAARLSVVALGVAGVAAAWWLGRRAYGAWAGWTAGTATAVATTHVAYSHVAVTDVPLTLGITAGLALLLAGRLEWAGAVAGLAASVKYPGVFLLVPLVVAGWGRWRRLAAAAGLAAATFALTSPFVLIHAGQAAGDAARVQRLARAGCSASSTICRPHWRSSTGCGRGSAQCSSWLRPAWRSPSSAAAAPISCSPPSPSSTSPTCSR